MTNDLLLTLDLLDALPDLRLLADLSRYVVAREIPLPDVPDETQRQIMRVLWRSWAIHGSGGLCGSGAGRAVIPVRTGSAILCDQRPGRAGPV